MPEGLSALLLTGIRQVQFSRCNKGIEIACYYSVEDKFYEKEIKMRKIMLTMLTLMSALLLFSDLVVEPGFEYAIVGPAYTGTQEVFVSDTLYVTNTGATEEFNLIMNVDIIPDGWITQWCHEYEGTPSLCHFPGTQ